MNDFKEIHTTLIPQKLICCTADWGLGRGTERCYTVNVNASSKKESHTGVIIKNEELFVILFV